jgi:hypothetical protein
MGSCNGQYMLMLRNTAKVSYLCSMGLHSAACSFGNVWIVTNAISGQIFGSLFCSCHVILSSCTGREMVLQYLVMKPQCNFIAVQASGITPARLQQVFISRGGCTYCTWLCKLVSSLETLFVFYVSTLLCAAHIKCWASLAPDGIKL